MGFPEKILLFKEYEWELDGSNLITSNKNWLDGFIGLVIS